MLHQGTTIHCSIRSKPPLPGQWHVTLSSGTAVLELNAKAVQTTLHAFQLLLLTVHFAYEATPLTYAIYWLALEDDVAGILCQMPQGIWA